MLDLLNLVNEVSDLLYVADLDTYELLFMNRAGKEAFGLEALAGQKCYAVLQGRDSPCAFCTNAHLQYHQFYVWQHTNPLLNRYYMLKDKLIDWAGHRARVEIAFDITPNEEERRKLQHSLEAENLVTECARILFGEHEEDQETAQEWDLRIQAVLEKVGSFLESDRCYLFQIRGERMDDTHEWCADRIAPQITNLQNMPIRLIDTWQEAFQQRTCIQWADLEAIRGSCPTEYEILSAQGIHSLIAAPIFFGRRLTGYLGVDNYAVQKLGNASAILAAIGYFIGALQQNQKNIQLLKQMSYQDALTGLGNRNQFHQDIQAYRQAARPMGVIYLDLNGMKQINDRYGHQEGDAALMETSGLIRSVFPAESAYRNGGDEFVVLCRDMPEETFQSHTRELRRLFAVESKYAAAIGASWSDGQEDLQELLLLADERMYHDKRSFYRGRETSGRYRHEIDDVLNMTKPGALQRLIEQGKLIIYFQPKIDMDTFRPLGAEALVRYELSPGNIIAPANFIPILEESRLISILDFYMFGAVCREMRRWLEEGRTLHPISINFSRYTLSERSFVEKLQKIWTEDHVPKELLEIEVTETVEADDCYDFLGVIREIKNRGFSVSIDDFGVKNANLSLFTSMDFDVLKIDKSLVSDLAYNVKSQAILSSISEICHKMHIKMIVEGVETQEQLQVLQGLHCDGVQGFLFSKPIPLAEFEQQYL